MSLTTDDLRAVRRAVDDSINERMPVIIDVYVKPMFTELEQRINGAFEDTQAQINDVKTGIGGIKTEISGIKKDVKGLKVEMGDIKKDVKNIKVTVRHLELRGTLKT